MSGNVQNAPALRPAVQPVAPPPKQDKGFFGGLFGHVADVFVGGGEALWDMGKGLVTMVTHPVQTIKGLGYVVTHPGALVDAFVNPYKEAIAEGRPGKALGRGIVEIGTLFITGGSSGAAVGGAKGAATAANVATKAGRAAGVATKAGKAGQAASAASKVAGAASKAAKVAAASKPILTKAAAAAAKQAGVTEKVARAGLKAAHLAYWEARAAGKTAQVAKAAAAAKAARAMGLAKNAALVEKVVNGARLSGAAARSAQIASKVSIAGRLSKAAIAARGLPGTAVNSIKGAARSLRAASGAASAKVGSAAQRLGALTLKDLALSPITATKAVAGGARNILGKAWTQLPSASGAARALPGALRAGATKAGDLMVKAIRLPSTLAGKGLQLGARVFGRAGGMLGAAGAWVLAHPRATGLMAIGSRLANDALAGAGDPSKLSDEQVAAIAGQFKLKPTRDNVQKFVQEVQGYAGNAIGPDSGSPEEVKQLQTVLGALGYDVEASGQWDEKTTAAVIDFKAQNGLAQSYLLADGSPAYNEYVDETAARALITVLQGGELPAAPEAGQEPAPGTQPVVPPSAGPAYKTYTVSQMDRATGLSGIARHHLGDAGRWKEIYELNKDLIGDNPNLILPGQKLRMPGDAKRLPVERTAAAPPPAAAPPAAIGPAKLDAQQQQIAEKYGLELDPVNVQNFLDEINSYRANAIGPDTGSPDDVRKLQEVLVALGRYPNVKATGQFDDATADAVIAFKQANGLHSRYRLGDGNWAINEYVDETTARSLAKAVGGQ